MALLIIHIVAGLLGLASGAVALYACKGAKLHRQSGMIFVYAMLSMSASGAAMATLHFDRVTTIVAVLTFYLVTTALLTVRRPFLQGRWIDAGALLVGLTVGIGSVRLGIETLQRGADTIDSYPVGLVFIFGVMALIASLGDVRMLLARGLQGRQRMARHVWRMCVALWIAAASFFLGQADLFPSPIRATPLLGLPVLLIVIVMFYWLVRVLFTQWRSRTQ